MDRIRDLYHAGSMGLDRSPGDPLCAWAFEEIMRLRRELARLEKQVSDQAWKDSPGNYL